MGKSRPYTWKCDVCGEIFKTRKLLYSHWNEKTEHHIIKTSATHKGEYYCKYCNKFCDQLNSLHLHEKHCILNPNRIDGTSKGRTMTDEFKKKQSERMKERHKNGTAVSLAHLRSKEKPSYPEQWLMDVIKNENINSEYIREYKFHTFSLDFYWEKKKKVIEMDGRLHKISEYQKDCDKRKDEQLKKDGIDEMRIDWEYCYNHPKEIIKKIKDFIGE